ncbi:DUF4097 domain-containing protein [Thermococcus sp. GR6]|uniref:DUF4097 domain-containing protein n=1 Tax=Thermococcus sp. GR6 TaxID=1638256 RepID=UPI0014318750|nr:DUF4097 domain-containing protein [Thermococcus sp. GR6]NJE42161.1 hypothetical protein [Thermococcus sp. GR6]
MRFDGVRRIELHLVAAETRVESWDESYVELTYELHGDDVKVDANLNGETLTIKEKPRRRFFNRLGKDSWAEITLKVPRGVTLRVDTVIGKLRAEGVRFEEATTVNGTLILEECEAEMLKTVNGEIRPHLPVAGPLKASTVNGDIELTIEELEDDIEVNCVNGNMTLCLTDFCDARIISKKVNGNVRFVGINPNDPIIGTGELEVKVSTVNGDVKIELV